MSELHNLFNLANNSQGYARESAEKLLIPAIKEKSWTSINNDLLGPLDAGYETFPDVPGVSAAAYQTLLRAASDKILADAYKIQDLKYKLDQCRQKVTKITKIVSE